jgi:hypothetical protein
MPKQFSMSIGLRDNHSKYMTHQIKPLLPAHDSRRRNRSVVASTNDKHLEQRATSDKV